MPRLAAKMRSAQKSAIEDLSRFWEAAEGLVSPASSLREESLAGLAATGVFSNSPLAAYLLATRITDPDLEVRFHAVQILGDLVDFEGSRGSGLDDLALKHVHHFLAELGKDQLIMLLEVAERYLAAEEPIRHILSLCSYAGGPLRGIVNDQKLPFPIRQLAVYFSGEVGFQEMVPVLENLIKRLEKRGKRLDRRISEQRAEAEQTLAASARVALTKLGAEIRPAGM